MTSARITGFSEAVSLGGKGVVTHAGTYRYMAPEVILGEQPYSFPVDCWGLGCIGYELCTRHPVYLPPSGSLLDILAGILNNPYDSDYLIARAKAHGLFYVSLLLLVPSSTISFRIFSWFANTHPWTPQQRCQESPHTCYFPFSWCR